MQGVIQLHGMSGGPVAKWEWIGRQGSFKWATAGVIPFDLIKQCILEYSNRILTGYIGTYDMFPFAQVCNDEITEVPTFGNFALYG